MAYPGTHTIALYDDPHAALNTAFPYNIYVSGQFKDYVQFRPDSYDSIFVTLGTNGWSMAGEATLTSGIITNSTPAPTAPVDTDEFPNWTKVRHE